MYAEDDTSANASHDQDHSTVTAGGLDIGGIKHQTRVIRIVPHQKSDGVHDVSNEDLQVTEDSLGVLETTVTDTMTGAGGNASTYFNVTMQNDQNALGTAYQDFDELNPNSQCLICGDRASGVHYGCLSCEGCKGFFKRTVQKNLTYSCRDQGACVITKYTRNSCQFCRYHKCLEFGMRREAISEEFHEDGDQARRKNKFRYDEHLLQPPAVVEPDVVGAPEEHGLTLEDQDEMLENILASEADSMPAGDPNFSLAKTQDQEIAQSQLREYCFQDLRLAIDWSKRLHAFQELSSEDQLQLIQASFLPLCCLRLAFRSLKLNPSTTPTGIDPSIPIRLLLTSNCIVNPDQVMESSGFAKAVVDTAAAFVRYFPYVQMATAEFSCLCTVVLFAADAFKLEDVEQVQDNQIRAASALRKCCIRRHLADPPRAGRFLLRLPSLRLLCLNAAANNPELSDPVARNQLDQFISQNLFDTIV